MDTFYVADVGTAASVAPPTAFSCVVDDDPHLVAQCFIWLKCLLEIKSMVQYLSVYFCYIFLRCFFIE